MPEHDVLVRQLRRLGLDGESAPTDEKLWRQFLDRIGATYSQMDEDRYLLERSLEISSRELNEINSQLQAAIDDLQTKNRLLNRVNSFFRSTLAHMITTVERGAAQDEVLVYLMQVQSEFNRIDQNSGKMQTT